MHQAVVVVVVGLTVVGKVVVGLPVVGEPVVGLPEGLPVAGRGGATQREVAASYTLLG